MGNPRPMILALAFGLIAVVLVYLYIRQVESAGPVSEMEMVRVVRATAPIPPRNTIRDHMIEEVELPADAVTSEMVTEMDEVLGEVSVVAIPQGQFLMYSMFKAETALEDLSRQIPEGDRAVTVGVTEVSGLGGNLKPGDKVDVLVSIINNEEVGVPSTFTILKNISVLAVGQDVGFQEGENGGGITKSVTLQIMPNEAQILALASEVGSIRLVLRHPDDQFAPSLQGTALTDFATYTATRKDLEEQAQRAREEADAERERYMASLGAYVSSSPQPDTYPPEFFNNLPEPGPPPILVEVILGGESQIVELQR